MDIAAVVSQLGANRATFDSLLRDLPGELQLWRPHPDHWCLLENVCHLYDEERDDFRTRVRSVLEDPSRAPPSIDPEGWVESRRYMQQDYAVKLEALLEERSASVRWLASLVDPAWDNAYEHPKLGPLTARMFLTNWLAHDHLHMRQIIRLKYQYLAATSGTPLDYAGEW